MGCAEALGRSRTPQSPLGAAFAPVPVQAEASSYHPPESPRRDPREIISTNRIWGVKVPFPSCWR